MNGKYDPATVESTKMRTDILSSDGLIVELYFLVTKN